MKLGYKQTLTNEVLAQAPAGYLPDNRDRIYESGAELVAEVEQRGVDFHGARVLDVGCGNGRWAAVLYDRGVERYLGLDVVPGSIDFCSGLFDGAPGFDFEVLPIRSRRYYDRPHQVEPEDVVFPTNETFDVVIASSLFTHLETYKAGRRYLDEMIRVCHPGGVIYTTWFLDPPNEQTDASDKGRRTVYDRKVIVEWLMATGQILDAWDGQTTDWHDQAKFLVRSGEADG